MFHIKGREADQKKLFGKILIEALLLDIFDSVRHVSMPCRFFKRLTGNDVKIWDQCDIMAFTVLSGQFVRFIVGRFHFS